MNGQGGLSPINMIFRVVKVILFATMDVLSVISTLVLVPVVLIVGVFGTIERQNIIDSFGEHWSFMSNIATIAFWNLFPSLIGLCWLVFRYVQRHWDEVVEFNSKRPPYTKFQILCVVLCPVTTILLIHFFRS